MKVGVPKEVKNHEYRVAITPAGVNELVRNGHEVFIEANAGIGSLIPDEDFVAAGACMLPTADDVWQSADLILKVKEPVAEEYHRMQRTRYSLPTCTSRPQGGYGPCSARGHPRSR
jgi:alanine dehydrogenase